MNRKYLFAMFALSLVILASACHRSDQVGQLALNQPDAPSSGTAGTGVAAGVGAGGEGLTQATIDSDSPCKADTDCTFSKLENIPKTKEECRCIAPCTPYVVSDAEREARMAAYTRLCRMDDVFGPDCTAPECRFIEFASFRCIGGKCTGTAIGKK